MKKMVKTVIAMSVIAFASVSIANPKCSHRVASNSNDLLRNTNPVKAQVVKTTAPAKGSEKSRSGVQ